jgi:hypothetical protein
MNAIEMELDDKVVVKLKAGDVLAHDPEKWEPVFGKDHAQAEC